MTTNGACEWIKNECWHTGAYRETNNMGLVIGVGVGVLAVVACVVICVVVVKCRKANGIVEVAMGDADLFNTGFGNNSGNKSVVTVKMDGKDTVLELVEEVGHGSFATVWKAVDGNSKKVFAVKVVDGRRSVGATEAQKEAMMMEQLDTQFVVAVFGCGFTQNTMAIAMEFFPLGSLQNVLQQDKLPSNARVPMLLDIAKAMAYLHTNGIIHRDLKPGNVLVCSIDPNLHPMSKFVSFFLSSTTREWRENEFITTHNTQDIGLWRSKNSGVNGGKHDHDKWCGHTVFHGTRDGHWHQALHWCCGCVQLWHHGCSGDGWSSCL